MATVRDFEDLRVYQLAFEAAHRIYELSAQFPKEERYSLTDQVRRSSRSICANIAEAWRKRRYPLAFVNKLCDADGEAAETVVWLAFAARCGFIDADVHAKARDTYKRIGAQLCRMMDRPEQWTARVSKRGES